MATLSIIIPTYNRHEKTNRAIASALAAMDSLALESELIIVDDGSKPHFTLLAEHSRNNVNLIHHDQNKGVAAARNTGIKMSTGEILTFLDSDDEMIAQELPRRIQIFEDLAPQVDLPKPVLACGWQERTETGRAGRIRIPNPPEKSVGLYTGCWFSPGSCCLYDRQWFDRIGGFDEKLRRLEDYDWYIRYANEGGTVEIAELVGAHIEYGAIRPSDLIYEAIGYLFEKHSLNSVASISNSAKTNRAAIKAYLLLETAAAQFGSANYLFALATLARSFMHWPRFGLHLSPGWSHHVRAQKGETGSQ